MAETANEKPPSYWAAVTEIRCWKWPCIWCQHRNTEKTQPEHGSLLSCAECGQQAIAQVIDR